MLLYFCFLSLRLRRIDSEVTVTQYCQRTAGALHRYIDGHKGRVAASMAWAGVGALDAMFVRGQRASTGTPSPRYLITYLVRRHARVELRPDLLRAERVGPRAELALRFYFVVRLQNLVDLVPRQQG